MQPGLTETKSGATSPLIPDLAAAQSGLRLLASDLQFF
jgi:hypothetical protein